MDYWSNVISLEEEALVKVTQKLCQDRRFKEAVLGFACVCPQNEAYVMTDEEREEMRHYFYSTAESYAAFIRARYFRYEKSLHEWVTGIEECIEITLNSSDLPKHFHHEARQWISRHIFEYLSYCRRMEVLTGLSRHFFVDFVTYQDWNTEGRLDEKTLAERLIEYEKLTVLQRYRIACSYCLTGMRLRLWEKLTTEEKNSLNQHEDPLLTFEYNRSVLFWSYHMKNGTHYKVNGEKNPWMGAAEIAVYDGNVFALRESWKEIQLCRQGTEASDMAFRCLNQWKICKASNWKRKLLALDCYSSPWSFSDFSLPTHYARLLSFLFQNMDEDELEMFFEELLTKRKDWDALIYFLDWPNLDYFLPTIRFLQRFIPDEDLKILYLGSLVTLESRHQILHGFANYSNEIEINTLNDYRRVLRKLWDETPEKYKRYAFEDVMEYDVSKYIFLLLLLEKHPFLVEDKCFFMRVFSDATSSEKKMFLMSSEWKKVYSTLLFRENWSLLDWLTKECFDEDENAAFRRWYIMSSFGREFCFNLLLKNKEAILKDLICWSLKSEKERKRFKRDLIHEIPHIDACLTLISKGNFLELDGMINFCLEPSEVPDFKKLLVNDDAFFSLIINHDWEILDRYLVLCFETEEKIADFKKKYFSSDGVDLFFHFVFRGYLFDIEKFYLWFDLSSDEIEKLKKDTVLSSQSIDNILELIYNSEPLPVILLLWSLQDEDIILKLKSKLESHLLDDSDETRIALHELQNQVKLLLTLKGLNLKDCDILNQIDQPMSWENAA